MIDSKNVIHHEKRIKMENKNIKIYYNQLTLLQEKLC